MHIVNDGIFIHEIVYTVLVLNGSARLGLSFRVKLILLTGLPCQRHFSSPPPVLNPAFPQTRGPLYGWESGCVHERSWTEGTRFGIGKGSKLRSMWETDFTAMYLHLSHLPNFIKSMSSKSDAKYVLPGAKSYVKTPEFFKCVKGQIKNNDTHCRNIVPLELEPYSQMMHLADSLSPHATFAGS